MNHQLKVSLFVVTSVFFINGFQMFGNSLSSQSLSLRPKNDWGMKGREKPPPFHTFPPAPATHTPVLGNSFLVIVAHIF